MVILRVTSPLEGHKIDTRRTCNITRFELVITVLSQFINGVPLI
jgi:hypothetical protein